MTDRDFSVQVRPCFMLVCVGNVDKYLQGLYVKEALGKFEPNKVCEFHDLRDREGTSVQSESLAHEKYVPRAYRQHKLQAVKTFEKVSVYTECLSTRADS